MKQRISLLIIVLYTMTAMGQNPKSTNLDLSSRKNASQLIQNRLFATKAHRSLDHKVGARKVAFKSVGVQKMALDSIVNVGSMKNIYTYDGNTFSSSYSEWDSLGLAWKPSFKVESVYDENGNVTSDSYSNWDAENMMWNTSSLTETVYDSYGHPKEEVITQLGDYEYVQESKFEYTYDKNGYPTLSLKFVIFDSVNWVNVAKTVYAFDANGNKLLETGYTKSLDINQEWTGSNRLENTFDSNNNLLSSTEYVWNFDSSEWLGSWRSVFTYNADQNPILEIDYQMEGIAWISYTKTEFSYDTTVSINDLLVPQGYREMGTNNMISQIVETSYNPELSSWTTPKSILLYYSKYIDAGIPSLNSLKMSIYPNPTAESFRVNGLAKPSTLSVLDLTGKLMFTKVISSNEPISINSLPKGIYLVKINSGNAQISQKLVKK